MDLYRHHVSEGRIGVCLSKDWEDEGYSLCDVETRLYPFLGRKIRLAPTYSVTVTLV